MTDRPGCRHLYRTKTGSGAVVAVSGKKRQYEREQGGGVYNSISYIASLHGMIVYYRLLNNLKLARRQPVYSQDVPPHFLGFARPVRYRLFPKSDQLS